MKKRVNKKNKEYYFIIKYIKKHLKSHILAFLLYIITVLLNLLVAYIMMQIIDKAIVEYKVSKLILFLLIYLTSNTILNILKVILEYIYIKIGKKILVDLRFTVLKSLFKSNGDSLVNLNTGLMLSIMHSDIPLLESLFTKMFPNIITSIVLSLGLIVLLSFVQPYLLLVIIAFETIAFYIQKVIGFHVKKINEEFVVFNTKSYSILQELFSNAKYVITAKGSTFFTNKFLNNERKLINTNSKLEIFHSVATSASSQGYTLTNFIVLGIGGYLVLKHKMTFGGLIMFLNYSGRLLSPIDVISQSYIKYQQAQISIKRILDVIDTPCKNLYKGVVNNDFEGNIKFNNVCFSYKNKLVLNHINLLALKGKITNIVGPSGSGKTTLINLVMGFWDNLVGEITIDGTNIKEYNLLFLRSKIAVVSQDIVLFDDTIFNNLVFNKKIGMNKVIECSKKSNAYNFIMELPNQYNTIIGEKGVTLSGGQRQKLALTRALLLDCPIIIFDEVTSSLDNDSSKVIQNSILDMRIHDKKTIIIITHKLTLSKQADMIYVLNNGTIQESGSHESLILRNGIYSHLYSLQ